MVDYTDKSVASLIKYLPEDLQRKIFFMSLEHPTAKIMKPLINEINEYPKCYLNLDSGKVENIGFTEALIGFGYLKDCWLEEEFYYEYMLDLMDLEFDEIHIELI